MYSVTETYVTGFKEYLLTSLRLIQYIRSQIFHKRTEYSSIHYRTFSNMSYVEPFGPSIVPCNATANRHGTTRNPMERIWVFYCSSLYKERTTITTQSLESYNRHSISISAKPKNTTMFHVFQVFKCISSKQDSMIQQYDVRRSGERKNSRRIFIHI